MQSLINLAEIIDDLNSRWKPNDWQIPPVRALFYEGKKDIGAECGRSSGKTDLLSYCFWRYAQEVPGSENYIFEPLQNQAREILWAPRRIQEFGNKDWIESINNTEMRITFKNGSFIKLDGSDNVDKLRGIKPKGLIAYDELKDHKREFLDAMEPNRARYNAPALYTGTPPEKWNHFVQIMEQIKKDPNSHYSHATSYDNPHNDRAFLDKKKAQLIEAGLKDIWDREYLAIFTLGGHRSIFPMIVKMPLVPLEEAWPKDSHKWTLMVGKDPASSSTFGVTFWLYNPFNKRVISVGEIHETRPEYMTARRMYQATLDRVAELRKRGIKDVRYVYDNAARWYAQEINEIDVENKMWLEPCDKTNGLQGEISCWRGVAVHGLLTLTDATPELKKELDNYILDEKGRLPDKEDDLLQSGAYALRALGFDFTETLEPRKLQKEEPRFHRMEEEILTQNSYEDLD